MPLPQDSKPCVYRLEHHPGGIIPYCDERPLLSLRNPLGRPRRIAAGVKPEHQCLYFLPSPLMGQGIEELLQRLPEDSAILAIEASQELFGLCSPHIPPALIHHPRIHWARFHHPMAMSQFLTSLELNQYRRYRRINFGSHSLGSTYDALEQQLAQDLAAHWRNRHVLERLGRHWIRHSLSNLQYLSTHPQRVHSAADFRPQGLPVVVGAGPSLDTALPFLRTHRSQLCLIAVDTALPSLLAAELEPQLVVALETQAWNLLDFHGSQKTSIPIAADLTAYPATLEATQGELYLFSSQFASLNYLRRLAEAQLQPLPIPALGSVGLAAVELALATSQGPILLCGLDFSAPAGKSHSRGSLMHRWALGVSHRLNPSPAPDSSLQSKRRAFCNGLNQKIYADGVLEGYATLFRRHYQSHPRLAVLHPGGTDLGLPLLKANQAKKLIHAHQPLPPKAPSEWNPQAASAFLQEERQRLQAVIRAWESYAANTSNAQTVCQALEGLDEIFCDFPDSSPLPREDNAFLVRAVQRTRRLLTLLETPRREAGSS
ncbi:MAG: DUF115 domain-containing protein [Spirochaetales bacterium]|nr:DUF115 domain-containing protein [Spirochaetales bacterium]